MNQKLMETVIRLSKNLIELTPTRSKHFSFACRRNTVCGIGWNKVNKTHPLAMKHGYRFNNIHSELDCIIKLDAKPSELCQYKLVNVRLDKYGIVRMSKPCIVCQKLLNVFNFNEVLYSNNSGSFERL